MVRITRSRQASEDVLDNEELDDFKIVTKGPPSSNPDFDYKMLVAQQDKVFGCNLYLLPHPKNGAHVLYNISKTSCDEVVSVEDQYSSWFYGDSVIAHGGIRLLSPVHPIFLAMQYLWKNKETFKELSEIIQDEQSPAVVHLLHNEKLTANLEKVADIKHVCDVTVYRLNEERCLEWLCERFKRVKTVIVSLEAVHKNVAENEDALNRYCFAVLCDFLIPEAVPLLKTKLGITDPKVEEVVSMDMPMKRKMDDEFNEEKQIAKKPKESVASKQLKQASKGIKSISSFFGKPKK